jgi:hypothetical protein
MNYIIYFVGLEFRKLIYVSKIQHSNQARIQGGGGDKGDPPHWPYQNVLI